MAAKAKSLALIIDDNLADIELFETAWTNAGHHESIGIYPCTSCEEAMVWLHEEVPPGHVVTGVLSDLMLFDAAGNATVDVLSALPLLKNVPVISWSGIDFGEKQTDRIRKSATSVWTKPQDWMAWSVFVRRFYNLLQQQSAASSSRHPAV